MRSTIIALQHLGVITVCMPAMFPESMQKMNEFYFNSHNKYKNDVQMNNCLIKARCLLPVIVPHSNLELLKNIKKLFN